ncbi:MAG: hypothetical protein IPM82_23880 [Saprospiraceae bacterium]|nr:hypothetical protein [Saprospiraceae bacterium]
MTGFDEGHSASSPLGGAFPCCTVVEVTDPSSLYTVSNVVVRLLLLGMAVYCYVYRLRPGTWPIRSFCCTGFLLLTVFIVTPVEVFIYAKSGNYPEMQAVVLDNLNWAFAPNFLC